MCLKKRKTSDDGNNNRNLLTEALRDKKIV